MGPQKILVARFFAQRNMRFGGGGARWSIGMWGHQKKDLRNTTKGRKREEAEKKVGLLRKYFLGSYTNEPGKTEHSNSMEVWGGANKKQNIGKTVAQSKGWGF